MKRSEINALVQAASEKFKATGWVLPPEPNWDVTDFGLGDWRRFGLVLINLSEEPEYCEKLMYAKRGMVTPAHCHKTKKEDIICRSGNLRIRVWSGIPDKSYSEIDLKRNGHIKTFIDGENILLSSGERITIIPGIYHEFEPLSDDCVIGEVSTGNDDINDNFFVDRSVGRFPHVEEDEPPLVTLVSDGR